MPPWAIVVTVVCSVGSLVLTLVVLYHKGIVWLGERMSEFSVSLEGFRGDLAQHAKTLTEHSNRMATSEERYIELAQDLQRLIGRSEVARLDDQRQPAGSGSSRERRR